MQDKTLICRRRLLAAPIAAALSVLATVAHADVFQCKAVSTLSLGAAGDLRVNSSARHIAERHAYFTIDTATGWIEGPLLTRQKWTVVRGVEPSMDALLVGGPTLERAADDFYRVRTWALEDDAAPVRFIHYGLSTVVTGTCVPLS